MTTHAQVALSRSKTTDPDKLQGSGEYEVIYTGSCE